MDIKEIPKIDKQYKTFKGEIKSVNPETFTVEAIVSSEAVDRYNEVIKMAAWQDGMLDYINHPILLSSHNYGELTKQIGIAEDIRVEGGNLVARFRYLVGKGNSEADWGFQLAKEGLAAYSVGFTPLEYITPKSIEGQPTISREYTKVNLLEISQVLIPANQEALQRGLDSGDEVIKFIAKGIQDMGIETKDVESPLIPLPVIKEIEPIKHEMPCQMVKDMSEELSTVKKRLETIEQKAIDSILKKSAEESEVKDDELMNLFKDYTKSLKVLFKV